jgi:thioredoxin-like negative regulator of GroEL
MKGIFNLESLRELILEKRGLVLYFSNDMCSVCRVLKPKVEELLSTTFPEMEARYIEIDKSPLLSGQYRVFTIPTILIYFDGREQARLSRNISIHQLTEIIQRPYTLLFGE